MNRRNIIIWLLALSLAGCSFQAERFPNKVDDFSSLKELDIIVDVTIVSDIEGFYLGIDKDKHSKVISETKKLLTSRLLEKNIKANFIFAGSGIFFEKEENKEYFWAEGFNSIGTKFDGYPQESDILNENTVAFLKRLDETAASYRPKLAKGKKYVEPLVIDDIPSQLLEYSPNQLAVFRVLAFDMHRGKSFVYGAAATALSASLTGGSLILITGSFSATQVNFVLLNPQTGRVLWQNTQAEKGARIIPLIAANAAASYIGKPIKRTPNRARRARAEAKQRR